MDHDAEPGALLRSLAETTARVEAVVRLLPAAQLAVAPASGGWSPNEILWHIRAVADVYGEHVKRLLDDEAPRWRHISPRSRMKKARYDERPFAESCADFARQRSDLLALLGSIPPDAWLRFAIVRVKEREWRMTLQERVWGMAHHEEIHCAQMEEAASALSMPA